LRGGTSEASDQFAFDAAQLALAAEVVLDLIDESGEEAAGA
jgi:hypothetical protein